MKLIKVTINSDFLKWKKLFRKAKELPYSRLQLKEHAEDIFNRRIYYDHFKAINIASYF